MNVNEIELALSQKITSSSSNLDVLVATKVLSYLKTNGIFTTSVYGNLPSAASNEGKLYFVEDLETLFWSDGTDWLQLLSKSVIEFQLWNWGSNTWTQLGDGTTTSTCSPVREICSATDWCQVSTGSLHIAAIKTSGELWAWGQNSCGNLGDGTFTTRCSPVREFYSATDWCQVSVSQTLQNSVAIKTSGELWAWGRGTQIRIGDGTTTTRCSPVREFCSATDWCQVSIRGCAHTAAVKTSGQIWVWGCNGSGRLGDGTSTTRCSPVREICSATDWCQVDTGGTHTAAVKTSGQIWSWGNNNCGQLGTGTTTNTCSPVREICSATDWCQVSAGNVHTAAIKTSGELWSWAGNASGQLGNGTTTPLCSPVREICSVTEWCQVSTGRNHSAALKTSGEIWAWGANSGRLGNGTTTNTCSPVREITSAQNWCQVSSGSYNMSAIKIV